VHSLTIGSRATLNLTIGGTHRVKIVGARVAALSEAETVTRDNLELEVIFTGRNREAMRPYERYLWPLHRFSDADGKPIRFRHGISGEAREVV